MDRLKLVRGLRLKLSLNLTLGLSCTWARAEVPRTNEATIAAEQKRRIMQGLYRQLYWDVFWFIQLAATTIARDIDGMIGEPL